MNHDQTVGEMKYERAFSSFSVYDLQEAEAFYRDVVGLEVARNEYGLHLHVGGTSDVFLYPKRDHVPATFTVLNFVVSDIKEVVDSLRTAGVQFDRYDTEQLQADDAGIHRSSDMAIAWFKDPAGNVLSLIEETTQQEMNQ
jgi:catechol 2,3-dioxygenase-like lactoylglutathione lyase family enzyme